MRIQPHHAKRPWQWLYDTGRWRKLRKLHLMSEPLCRMCMQEGRVMAATVVDHIVPHKGDVELFYSGPFQSLCKPCHDRHKQAEERGGRAKPAIGTDGWPVE